MEEGRVKVKGDGSWKTSELAARGTRAMSQCGEGGEGPGPHASPASAPGPGDSPLL